MYQRRAAALCAFSAFAAIPATLIALPAQAAAVRCHGERATIVGTTTDDVLQGTAGRDVIAGLAGDDTIDGRGGDDLLCGGRGTDRLTGGHGDDRLFGGKDGLRETDEGTSRTGDT